MIKNYLQTACRNIIRNRLYSGITVLGLTTGLAVGMLVLLWVQDEMSYDAFHSKAANIYRVNSPVGTGASRKVWETTQASVAAYALKEIPGVVNAVRLYDNYDYSVYSRQGKLFDRLRAVYADTSFFTVFDFRLVRGDVRRPWTDDRSVVVTESIARRYFGHADPMGQVIQGDHKDNFVVSGVVADFPDNSSIDGELFFSMELMRKKYQQEVNGLAKTLPPGAFFWPSMNDDWGDFGFSTFLEVRPGVSTEQIGRRLLAIQHRQAPQIAVSLKENAFQLQALSTIHLQEADGRSPVLQTVRIFLAVAIFILLIASINYVNLSTARAMLRAKEVSVRKIIGAARRQLFVQFMVESLLFYGLSLVLALLVIFLVVPYYNDLTGKHFVLRLTDPGIWKIVVITGAGTLLAAAVYPALLLSSFRPLLALKGKVSVGVGNILFRKILVTTQFVFSIGLMISTLVIGRQLNYIRERDPGYDRSQVFTVWDGKMQQHGAAVAAELGRETSIKGLALATMSVVDNGNTTGDTDWDGKAPNSMFIVNPMGIDERFIPLMKMKLASGANFSGRATDSAHFILNETAVRMAAIKNPVGKRFKLHEVDGTIIGVVSDFNFTSMHEHIGPVALYYRHSAPVLYIKTTGGKAAQAVAAVRRIWAGYNRDLPFDYTFLDQQFASLYRTDEQLGQLFRLFAGIAIFLSCLGLFGLAAYTAQVRTREIGIRKVLGASLGSIVVLLSRDFLRLVIIAIVVASPLSWLYLRDWLQDFVYRITIGWWVFVVAGGAAILLALLTIGWQAIRAAVANPVDSLRSAD